MMKMLAMPGLSSTFVLNELFIVIVRLSFFCHSHESLLCGSSFLSSCAEYYHPANLTCSIFNGIRYIAYCQQELARGVSYHPGSSSYSSSAVSNSIAISSAAQSPFTNASTAKKGVFFAGLSIDGKNSNNSNGNNNYDEEHGSTV